ncbi:MAG: glycosyltransferase [Chloroflexota bacterium]
MTSLGARLRRLRLRPQPPGAGRTARRPRDAALDTPPPADLDAAFLDAATALAAGDRRPAAALAGRMLRRDVRTPVIALRVARLLGDVSDPGAELLGLRARARWHAGEPSVARDDARAALALLEARAGGERRADGRPDPAAQGSPDRPRRTERILQRHVTRIEGELRALAPGWPPLDAPPQPGTPAPPRHPGRILHLVSTSRPWAQTGFSIRTHEIARAQLDAGLEPHVATPPGFPGRRWRHGARPVETLDGVTYHRMLPDHRSDLAADAEAALAASELLRLAEQLEPAAIGAAQGPSIRWATCAAALAVARRLGLPAVLEVRAFREEVWHAHAGGGALVAGGGLERYRLLQAADLAAWQAADQVVALGGVMRDEIVARGVAAERVSVIPNAVDGGRFTPGPRDAALAERLGLHPDEVVIGQVGGLAPWEGLDVLLAAVAALVARGRRVRVLLVGDGGMRAQLRAQVAALGLGDVAILAGRVPYATVVDHLRLIDVFVVPRVDTLLTRLVTPIKPVEALAAGSALVVSDLPALRELVTDGETGRTAEAGGVDSLVEVLDELVGDPDQRARLGVAGRAWALRERSLEANGRRYREIHERLGAA